jgi:hypothetical protein
VTVTAVYGRDDVPAGLKAAALALVGYWYKHREGGPDEVPASVVAMVRPHRVGLVG